MASFAVILAAAGRSSRFKDQHYKKPFVPLSGKAVWLYSAERFLNRNDVKQLILVISPEDREDFQLKFGANIAILGVEVVNGGNERADSVQAALAHVRPDIDFVAVHDAARPCLSDLWIDEIFAAAEKQGAVIPAVPLTGTIKRSADGSAIEETVPRTGLWEAQTPQVFQRQLLLDAYAKLGEFRPTDEAQAVEHLGRKVAIVNGSRLNLKITTREDLRLAEQCLKVLPKPKLQGPLNPFADDDMWR